MEGALSDPVTWLAVLFFGCAYLTVAIIYALVVEFPTDPPPLKWSDLRYVFDSQEGHDGKEALQG
jgi:hypothetical protein